MAELERGYNGIVPRVGGRGSNPVPLWIRFWKKVQLGDSPWDCWEWMGARKRNGYGMLAAPMMHKAGHPLTAHRVSFEFFHRPIPEGLVVDHLCHNPGCVNPLHLQLLTRVQNSRRQKSRPPRTHCKRGHPWIAGQERCYTCRKMLAREAHHRRKS